MLLPPDRYEPGDVDAHGSLEPAEEPLRAFRGLLNGVLLGLLCWGGLLWMLF